jgi:outer membrane protein, adhesin transport system
LQPPERVARAPARSLEALSDEALAARAETAPPVRVADATARAAKADAAAARADTYPNVTAGIDAGRYGLFEPGRRDYDIRGRLTLRLRLFGSGDARADEARAMAEAAEARAQSARMEAEREVRIAWSDVRSLVDTLDAYRNDYTASRVTRDATAERFRVLRGTLFDALDSEERLFTAAASYIQALAEHDTAIFVAHARSGDLLRTIGVEPADRGAFR